MNNKGQAFIESILLLSLVTVACLFLIRLGLHLQHEILIDDFVEGALICKLQKKVNCVNQLKDQFHGLNYKSVEVTDLSNPDEARIRLRALSELGFEVLLESELALGLQVD